MKTTYDAPTDSVAARALIQAQDGITKVKEIITVASVNNWTDEELTKRLNKTIAECCKKFADKPLSEAVRKSLVNAARKWNWELKNAIEVHNKNLLNKAQLDDFNYTVDVFALMSSKQGVTRREFRNTLNTGVTIGEPIIRDYRRSMTIALRALAAEPPVVATQENGKVRKMSLRNLAEMTVRHEASLNDIARLRAQGVKYVWTTSHPNCSPRCAKYQGKLWSLDGTSGTLEGNSYRPIEIALAGPLKDGNGIISGYNCRHRLVVWFPGSKAPMQYTEVEIKKAYAIDQRQRAYENNIRQMKVEEKLMRAAGYDDRAKALRKKWRIATQDYKLYSLENERPYYMYRCMVDESETVIELTEAVGNDIISISKTPWAKDENGVLIPREVQNDHKGLPRVSTPLNVIDKHMKKGGVQRACYDELGRVTLEIHTDTHGNDKHHSGEHMHVTVYVGKDKYRLDQMPLTKAIRKLNKDILS